MAIKREYLIEVNQDVITANGEDEQMTFSDCMIQFQSIEFNVRTCY